MFTVFFALKEKNEKASMGENCLGIRKRDWETSCVQISPD